MKRKIDGVGFGWMVIVKAKTQNILLMQDLSVFITVLERVGNARKIQNKLILVPEEETRDLISLKIWSDAPRALL